MKVILADFAGFCWGVKRVVKLSEDILSKGKNIFSYGPLIHNNAVIAKLENQGLTVLDDHTSSQLPSDATVIVRAHGVAPDDLMQFSHCKLVDGTCPHVLQIQRAVQKACAQNHFTLVLGDKGHAEVCGLMGFCKNQGLVISQLDDLVGVQIDKPIVVVCQSTLDLNTFQSLVHQIQVQFKNVEVIDTRCDATDKRQKAALLLAEKVELMVVIGGCNSANTMRLVKICREKISTIHLETATQINFKDFQGVERVGVTAGASTPDWLINEIVTQISSIC